MSYKKKNDVGVAALGIQQTTAWQLACERLEKLDERLRSIKDGKCTVCDEQEETTISALVAKYEEMKYFSGKKEELLTEEKSRVRGISWICNDMRRRILDGLRLKSGQEQRGRLLLAIGNVEPKEKVIEELEGLLACYEVELMKAVSDDKFVKRLLGCDHEG